MYKKNSFSFQHFKMEVKKVKRKIKPILLTEPLSVGNLQNVKSGTKAMQNHEVRLADLYARVEASTHKSKRKQSHDHHGTHYEHLSDFTSYVQHYIRLKSIQKKQDKTLYEYLYRMFSEGKYYSSKTHRFRRYH